MGPGIDGPRVAASGRVAGRAAATRTHFETGGGGRIGGADRGADTGADRGSIATLVPR